MTGQRRLGLIGVSCLLAMAAACAANSVPALPTSDGVMPAPSIAAGAAVAQQHRGTGSEPFDPVSISAVGARRWWLLGPKAILRTTDAGRRFTRLRVPPGFDRYDHRFAAVHFADRSDGYLFGKQLEVTHDHGLTWRPVHLGGRVTSVETGGGYTYATVGGRLHSVITRSRSDSNTWTTLHAPVNQVTIDSINGANVFATGLVKHRDGDRLLVSHTFGATWRIEPLPIEDLGCDVHQVTAPVLWEHCATGMLSGVWRSTDDGATFTQPAKEGNATATNSAVFTAPSSQVALLAFEDIQRTADGGRRWHRVGPAPTRRFWAGFEFGDANHGIGLRQAVKADQVNQVWVTRDAGAHWHHVKLP